MTLNVDNFDITTLYTLYRMIISEKIIPNNLFKKEGASANSPLHPHFRGKGDVPDPLHPSLNTGLGKTYIIILFLSNLQCICIV